MLQTSMEAIYESLVAPQGGSAPSTPKRGARLVRFNTSPPGVRQVPHMQLTLSCFGHLSCCLTSTAWAGKAACHRHQNNRSKHPHAEHRQWLAHW